MHRKENHIAMMIGSRITVKKMQTDYTLKKLQHSEMQYDDDDAGDGIAGDGK